jgi:hypothetical protein
VSGRRLLTIAGALVLATAGTAAAHGVGGRGDLPIPGSYFVTAAVIAVALSFVGVSVGWTRPAAERLAAGQPLGRWTVYPRMAVAPFLRTVGLLVLLGTIVVAFAGSQDSSDNLAPVMVYVVFWVGVAWLSALFGDVWRMLNPFDTIVMFASGRPGTAPPPHPDEGSLIWSHWPAAAGLFSFVWLELAYVEPASTTAVGVWLTAYTVVVIALAARFGRRWLQSGEGFTVLFGLLARCSPIGRRDDGTLRLRVPFTGLAEVAPRRGTATLAIILLGSTTFDGVSRTPRYGEWVRLTEGWQRTGANTLGLVVTILVVGAAYVLATTFVARIGGSSVRQAPRRYAHTLIPIALAYSVAHYFSLLMFEGQGAWRLISDPLGRGWDLFGTADSGINYQFLTAGLIATVQTVAMIVGHAAGVALAHDRALEDVGPQKATASQIPMLAVMIGFTVTGLGLLISV